jgi:hypothetical protein
VLVHRQLKNHYDQLAARVGLQNAREFWDHVAHDPGSQPPIANTCILRGRAGKPMGDGWSRTVHYEISSMGRIDYQFNDGFRVDDTGGSHSIVAILAISYSSH